MARRWRRILIIAIPAAAGLAGVAWLRYTHQSIAISQSELRRENEIRFTVSALQRAPAAFESIASAAGFRDAAAFQENLWVITASALHEVSAQGAMVRTFTTGLDLPPAPLVKLAAAVTAASQDRELFLATQGEGLLIFNGSAFRQMRPENPGHRKITALLALDSGQLLLGTSRHWLLVWE